MNQKPPEVQAKIIAAFLVGKSVRVVARAFHCTKCTALRYRAMATAQNGGALPLCSCGRPAGHKGWCHDRVQRSVKRQEFLTRWRKWSCHGFGDHDFELAHEKEEQHHRGPRVVHGHAY